MKPIAARRRLNDSRNRALAGALAAGVALGIFPGIFPGVSRDLGAGPGRAMAAADTNPAVKAFRSAEFRIVAKQEELSPEIRAAVAAYVKGEPVADPGRKWDATDVTSSPPLPRRRLVLAGVGKTLAFVAYEHGGRGKHAHVILLGLDGDKASLAYACAGQPIAPVNLDGLRAAVRKKTCAPLEGPEERE